MTSLSSFSPAGEPVVYTIEQKSTVPLETWSHFISRVMAVYYCLPFCMRPVNPRMDNRRISAVCLFWPENTSTGDELVFCGRPDEGYSCRIITISRERTRDVLSVDEIHTEFQMSVDLFTRMVMLALHNICGEHFTVHSSAGACSWALPLALLKSELNPGAKDFQDWAEWTAPEAARYSSFLFDENARLTEQAVINNLAGNVSISLAQWQWEDIVTLEFRLYEPVQEPSEETVIPDSVPEVDILLGTSRGAALFTAYQGTVTVKNFIALLHWVNVNVAEYKEGVPDSKPVFLSRNHLALLREDIRNGRFSLPGGEVEYGEVFYALQLLALWAEYCIHTLDFDRESAFLFASW